VSGPKVNPENREIFEREMKKGRIAEEVARRHGRDPEDWDLDDYEYHQEVDREIKKAGLDPRPRP
jgi:hypothetical protein